MFVTIEVDVLLSTWTLPHMALYKMLPDAEIHKQSYLFPHIVNTTLSLLPYIIGSDIFAIADGLVPIQAERVACVNPIVYFSFM